VDTRPDKSVFYSCPPPPRQQHPMQRHQSMALTDSQLPLGLIDSLLSFLGEELEGERLSQPARERQRSLLSHLRQQVGPGSRGGSNEASPRIGGPKARLSLPPQLYDSNFSHGSDGSEQSLEDYEIPGALVAESIPLPSRRRVSAGARRMSALPEQQQHQQQQYQQQKQQQQHPTHGGVSIVGPLWHRRRSCRWQRLPYCALHPTGLHCHKSRSAGFQQQQPTLSLALAGYTVLYVQRESQADHVIKLAHPSLPTHALAADTEEQARTWVRHLAAHAAGLPTPAFCSFLASPTLNSGLPAKNTTMTAALADMEPTDSGFSGPVSSSSNDDTCEPPPHQPQQTQSQSSNFYGVDLRRKSLAKSASFSPGVEPGPTASLPAAAKASSSTTAGGLLRRFRESFSLGAAVIARRRKSKLADDEDSAAAVAAAAATSSANQCQRWDPDALLSAQTEVRLGQETVWRRRQLQLRADGRLYVSDLLSSSMSSAAQPSTCIELNGLLLAPAAAPGNCGFRLATATSPEWTALEVRGLGKLEIGAWLKQLALATGLVSAYEPPAELLDLPSARAAALRQRLMEDNGGRAAVGRRASMPSAAMAEQLQQLQQQVAQLPMMMMIQQQQQPPVLERQHSMMWRPLPPTPVEAQRRGSLLLPAQSASYW
ncbi:hypothetical protein BOX15_Mlig019162g1, partial [Macrostomum lignano]